MRFLITGGAGFIGAALANRLARDGHAVRVIDDLSRGKRERLTASAEFTHGSVTDVPLLWTLLRDVDCVYHLAARVSVTESVLYPAAYNAVNVGGTVSLMEAVRDTGVKRVILASSGAIYGDEPTQPVSESDTPLPDSPYAVSKWSAEQYIHTIGRKNNIATVALRIFNTYGPEQPSPPSHAPVIPRLLQQVSTGGSAVIFGNGEQTRDFVFRSDVVAALVAAASAAGSTIDQQVFNIGSGTETSLNQLLATVERVVGKQAKPLYNREKIGGVPRLVADISKAQVRLGYRPLVSLEEGVRRQYEKMLEDS